MTLLLDKIAFERNFEYLFHTVNVSLHPGECLQVHGTNGSGKSTLLRMIAGYIEPHEGKILWNNQCTIQYRDNFHQHVQYVGHQNGIKSFLTVAENLKLIAALSQIKLNHSQIINILKKLDLDHLIDKQTQYLSAGQSRRLALARLYLNPSSLWIVDEPTTALDKHGQALFVSMIQEHLTQDGMVIVTTHHPLPMTINKTIYLGEQHA